MSIRVPGQEMRRKFPSVVVVVDPLQVPSPDFSSQPPSAFPSSAMHQILRPVYEFTLLF